MAEQSMFWPTTGTGDGTSGGYTSDRLASIWKSVLGDGLLKYLNDLEATGDGTTSLSINTGAALVNGYLYENTTSATIATSTLGSASYGLYIIANEGTTALTVSRSVSGTTVGAKTVRLALNSGVPTQPYIKLATVTTTAGNITTITTESNRWALSRAVPNSQSESMSMFAETLNVATSTTTTFVGSLTFNGDYGYFDGSGNFNVTMDGTYAIFCNVTWDSNTTNRRRMTIEYGAESYVYQITASSIISASSTTMQTMGIIDASAGSSINVSVWQDSGGTRTITDGTMRVVRM